MPQCNVMYYLKDESEEHRRLSSMENLRTRLEGFKVTAISWYKHLLPTKH